MLKPLREQAHITQEQLAYRVGVSSSTIKRWERNTDIIPGGKVVSIAKILNCSTDEILGNK